MTMVMRRRDAGLTLTISASNFESGSPRECAAVVNGMSSLMNDLIPFAFHCTIFRLQRILTSFEGFSAVRTSTWPAGLMLLGFPVHFGHLHVPDDKYMSCSILERVEQLLWLSRRQPAHIRGLAVGRVARSHITQVFRLVDEGLCGGEAPISCPTRVSAWGTIASFGPVQFGHFHRPCF